MYFPYLRGKQFELIALRELSDLFPDCKDICPLVEPVRFSTNGLTTAVKKMMDNNLKFALVLNPIEGDFRRRKMDLMPEIPELNNDKNKWIPAFLFQNNVSEIRSFVKQKNLCEVMVIFKDGIDTGNEEEDSNTEEN